MREKVMVKGISEYFPFRDITAGLYSKSLEEIRKHDIVRGVFVSKEVHELHDNKPTTIYYFDSDYGIHGRIFPFDEILSEGNEADIIVQSWKQNNPLNVDAQPYHDLYPGERIKINISKIEQDPMFKLFNRISGIVKNWENHKVYDLVKLDSRVEIEVAEIRKGKYGPFIFAKPIQLL
jgi:hypothetical protein